ncbi:uncharacterized protein LOC123554444 isoform X2 [Mercenaria mercenaria]|uniref:uncharacterized protein LOC123554444 isoform X2 n=1 Tax=Mercenaria mercenaria TaxID=6596 RepID=UPI00234F6868|nr:uncharacterized protein LOC123554444 isoform X2 [Mercenaria mercenaria]
MQKITEMKRQDRQADIGGKRQKLEMEVSKSTPEIIREEDNDDSETDEFTEVTVTTQMEDDDLETDGVKEAGTNKTYQISSSCLRYNDGTRPKLEDGFGFGKETFQYRIPSSGHPKPKKDRRVNTVSKASVTKKHREETSHFHANTPAANNVSPEREKKHKVNPCNTNNTENKTAGHCKTNSENKADIPEMDTIYTKQLQEWKLPSVPNEVPQDYADMSPRKLPTEQRVKYCGMSLKRQKPDQQTKILIPHKYADKPEGDDFGAALCTYIDHLEYGKIYYRHFFEKVEPAQPASEMKIKDDDELVSVNDFFVPVLPHTEVLNLFHHVKVDGKTRLSLVIRRKLSKQKWEWIETSAVLAPEKEKNPPAVTDLWYNEVEGDKPIERPMSKQLYKIPGTVKYIEIRDGKVQIGIMNDGNNRTMIIWKRTKFWQVDSEGHINFASTLCDVTKQWFIAIDQNDQIVVQRAPVWFKIFKVGSKIRFQFHELYLGYDLENNKLKAQVTDCLFEELPAPSVDAVDDVSASQKVDNLIEEGQNNAHQPSHKLSLRINVPQPVAGLSLSNSSDVASLSSADSGTGSLNFNRSSSSGTGNSDRQSVMSSQSSVSSGYRSASPEITDSSPNDAWTKAPTHGFPWSSHLAPINTPTTPFKNLDISTSESNSEVD